MKKFIWIILIIIIIFSLIFYIKTKTRRNIEDPDIKVINSMVEITIPEPLTEEEYEKCKYNYENNISQGSCGIVNAMAIGDPSLCRFEGQNIPTCFTWAAFVSKNEDICEEILEESFYLSSDGKKKFYRDFCFKALALVKGNETICERMKLGKGDCFGLFK